MLNTKKTKSKLLELYEEITNEKGGNFLIQREQQQIIEYKLKNNVVMEESHLIEEIRELYDLLEQVEQSKYEKLNIEKDEEVIEVEKIKFKYFKKGYLACMLGRQEK